MIFLCVSFAVWVEGTTGSDALWNYYVINFFVQWFIKLNSKQNVISYWMEDAKEFRYNKRFWTQKKVFLCPHWQVNEILLLIKTKKSLFAIFLFFSSSEKLLEFKLFLSLLKWWDYVWRIHKNFFFYKERFCAKATYNIKKNIKEWKLILDINCFLNVFIIYSFIGLMMLYDLFLNHTV